MQTTSANTDELQVIEGVNGEPDMEESKYLQWYQEDEERLTLETEKIEEAFPGFERTVLNDARLCFTGTIHGEALSAVCAYNHPIAPPEIYYLGEKEFRFVDEDGEIDILAIDESMRWDPNTVFIADLLERVRILLRLETIVRKEEKNDATDSERPESDSRPVRTQVPHD